MQSASEYTEYLNDLISSLYLEDDKAAYQNLKDKHPSVDLNNYDGFRLSHLILMKLRFENLMVGSVEAIDGFENHDKAFVEEFKDYHRATKNVFFFPPEEADAFQRFRES